MRAPEMLSTFAARAWKLLATVAGFSVGAVAALFLPASLVVELACLSVVCLVAGVHVMFGIGPALLCASGALALLAVVIARGVMRV